MTPSAETKSVAEVLLAAAALIETHGLAKGAYARDGDGRWVEPNDPTACSFCFNGAVASVLVAKPRDAETWLHENQIGALLNLQGRFTHVWSDQHSAPEVVALLRQAAALAQEQAK